MSAAYAVGSLAREVTWPPHTILFYEDAGLLCSSAPSALASNGCAPNQRSAYDERKWEANGS